MVRQAARPDGATLKTREAVRAVANPAAGAQPAADRVNGNSHHAPQHRSGLSGHQPVRPVRGGDLCPGNPAHDDREPGAYRTGRDDRGSRLPLVASDPGLIALDQVLDGVRKAAAITTPVSRVESRVRPAQKGNRPRPAFHPLLARRSLPPAVTVSSGAEEHLLARARDLDGGAEDLAETIAGVRARGGATALARKVLAGLDTAARVLTGSMTTPPAPARPSQPRRYATAEDFLSTVGEAEDDVAAAARQAARLRAEVIAALAAVRVALARAYAMPAKTPEQRIVRERAISEAKARIATCQDARAVLVGLRDRYREALRLLRQVPADLGWVYAAIYDMRRQGHELPGAAREWFDVDEGTVWQVRGR
jgi:hypothetical protein